MHIFIFGLIDGFIFVRVNRNKYQEVTVTMTACNNNNKKKKRHDEKASSFPSYSVVLIVVLCRDWIQFISDSPMVLGRVFLHYSRSRYCYP